MCLFEKKLYFDYIQPILNTFIRYNYKAQRQGNIRSDRVRGGFFNFLEIKVDIKVLRGWKWTTWMFFHNTLKDWSGLHYECYSTFRADIRQRLVAGSRGLHFLDYTHCENAVNLWLEIFLQMSGGRMGWTEYKEGKACLLSPHHS